MSTNFASKPLPAIVETIESPTNSAFGARDDTSTITYPKSVLSKGKRSILSKGERSVLTKTQEPQLVLHASFFPDIPKEFKKKLPRTMVPLNEIVLHDADGAPYVQKDWITNALLPCLWPQLKDFLIYWDIPIDASYFKDIFEEPNHNDHSKAIQQYLHFYDVDDPDEPLTFNEMQSNLLQICEMEHDELHWMLIFQCDVAKGLCEACEMSPRLVNEINMIQLPQADSIDGMVDKVGRALEAKMQAVTESVTKKITATSLTARPTKVTPSSILSTISETASHTIIDGTSLVCLSSTLTHGSHLSRTISEFGRVVKNIFDKKNTDHDHLTMPAGDHCQMTECTNLLSNTDDLTNITENLEFLTVVDDVANDMSNNHHKTTVDDGATDTVTSKDPTPPILSCCGSASTQRKHSHPKTCTPSHAIQLTTFRGHHIILQHPQHPHATPLAAATPISNPCSGLCGPSYSPAVVVMVMVTMMMMSMMTMTMVRIIPVIHWIGLLVGIHSTVVIFPPLVVSILSSVNTRVILPPWNQIGIRLLSTLIMTQLIQ